MPYFAYKCAFQTPLHIGAEHAGNALAEAGMVVRSDTLFCALCHEAVKNGSIEKLYAAVSSGGLIFSDMLPWWRDELYIPKPILHLPREQKDSQNSSAAKKAMKRLEYIPFSRLGGFTRGLDEAELASPLLNPAFGVYHVTAHVALLDNDPPKPYRVGEFTFADDAGLYVIVRCDDETKPFFGELLANVGYSGIGGRRSSGLGRFEKTECPVPDDFERALRDEDAPYQMLLGTAYPGDEHLDEALKDGWYKLVRRGGFVASDTYACNQVKKQTRYFIDRGSCLARRFNGKIVDVARGGAHPVWRCGKTLWMGVRP